MKVAILTDMHWLYKKNSQIYFKYFMKFYSNIFFPYLEEHNITTIIDLGDTTDDRKNLDIWGIHQMKKNFYDKLKEYTMHMLVGNHQTYYKNTNEINTPSVILKEYDNITIHPEITTINIDGRYIDLIPWINPENFDSVKQYIQKSTSEIALAHLEVNGATMVPGILCTHGTDPIIFSKYSKVLSGHLHFRHQYNNIFYIGNISQLHRGDEGAIRGFAVLDTETLAVEYINNPYKLFKSIVYDDSITDYAEVSVEEYRETYVKIYVENASDVVTYDIFLSKLYEVSHDVKIIEKSTNIHTTGISIDVENTNTIDLFSEYLDTMNITNTDEMKSIIHQIYTEATL